MVKYTFYTIILVLLGCGLESKMFTFEEGMGCGIGFYIDPNYEVLIRGCMDEWACIYVFQEGKQVEKIPMPPGFSGVDTILRDTIYISFCGSHPSEFNCGKNYFKDVYKGKMKVIPQCLAHENTPRPYQKLQKSLLQVDYEAKKHQLTLHTIEGQVKRNVHKMFFDNGLLIDAVYDLNVTNEYPFSEKAFSKLGKAILYKEDISIKN